MAKLQQFREQVTIYRKRKRNADGRQYTLEDLGKAIGLSADELGHRLRGNGKLPLSQENIFAIVLALAEWEALSWDEAVELLTWMDYPLDQPGWRAKLQRVLAPPPPGPGAGPLPVRRRPFQARKLPEGYIVRPNVFAAMKQLLLDHGGSQTTAITTALRGAGGFGKTTLALALCHDPDIQAAFPDGILWVELRERPLRPLEVLNGVLHSLDASLSGALTLEEAQENFRIALQWRVCLLVIDDVWQAEALTPLLEGGPQCVRLVTTRNDHVLPEKAARIFVDAMEPAEAKAVLCHNLPEEIQQAGYHPRLQALVTRLGCWPLLLTLARGMLANWMRDGKTVEQALSVVERAYQKRGVVAFHLASASERQRTVEACLDVSLHHLEECTPTRYHATVRYQELAVFPEDTDVPLTTLETYWRGTGGLEDWETEDLCSRLHGLSLLLSCDLGTGTIRLHDVIRNYLVQRAGSDLPALHGRLLDVFQQASGLIRWADLPLSETYLWQRLVFHLFQAGKQEVLQRTLADLLFVTRKVVALGVSALEADLALALVSLPHGGEEQALPPLAPLHQMIRRSSHLLRQVSSEAEVGGLLVSQLHDEARWDRQRLALEQELPRPWVAAWHALPHRSSSALIRTLHGHTDDVHACGYSPDGKWIVSASGDRTLKVWDSTTGAKHLTLSGHTDDVHACGFSPDGKWIVSASADQTLKVWEAATGVEHLTLSGHILPVTACGFSPDGKWIVSSSYDQTLKVWEAATGVEHLTLSGHTSMVSACGFSPDGKWIVSASWDGTLKVWDSTTGTEHLTLSGHTGSVTACGYSPDGRWIVSASHDRTLKVWEVQRGQCVLTHPVDGMLFGCAFHPDGEHLMACGQLGMYFLRLVS